MIHVTDSDERFATGPPPAALPPEPSRREHAGFVVIVLGAVAVVLAAGTWRVFELDRFFVPKELALHVAALAAGALALRGVARHRFGAVDLLLLGFILLSLVSTVFATNPWLAGRATAISVSAVLLFWSARALAVAGLQHRIVAALALAVVLGTGTALLQAYGVRSDFFSLNRAPGGTFGNRNSIGHVAALGLPLVLLAALRARTAGGYLLGCAGAALVAAALVLTRSRAGWLAALAAVGVLGAALLLAPALRRHRRTWLRVAGVVLLSATAGAAALVLPNTLRWRGDDPYLESVRGLTNYQEGSGRGRMIQYRRTLAMAASEPLLGVGPGNWGVAYPAHVRGSDPSLDRSAGGMTSNPWPSSDWVAYVAERGFPAAALLALAVLLLGAAAVRRAVRAEHEDAALAGATLVALLAATTVAGLFDAVLLLAVPTFIAWTAAGALSPPPSPPEVPPAGGGRRRFLVAALLVLAAAGTVRSGGQVAAMALHATGSTSALRLAARADPGNYRVHLALAERGSRAQRCRHAEAAHRLFPAAHAPRSLRRGCN